MTSISGAASAILQLAFGRFGTALDVITKTYTASDLFTTLLNTFAGRSGAGMFVDKKVTAGDAQTFSEKEIHFRDTSVAGATYTFGMGVAHELGHAVLPDGFGWVNVTGGGLFGKGPANAEEAKQSGRINEGVALTVEYIVNCQAEKQIDAMQGFTFPLPTMFSGPEIRKILDNIAKSEGVDFHAPETNWILEHNFTNKNSAAVTAAGIWNGGRILTGTNISYDTFNMNRWLFGSGKHVSSGNPLEGGAGSPVSQGSGSPSGGPGSSIDESDIDWSSVTPDTVNYEVGAGGVQTFTGTNITEMNGTTLDIEGILTAQGVTAKTVVAEIVPTRSVVEESTFDMSGALQMQRVVASVGAASFTPVGDASGFQFDTGATTVSLSGPAGLDAVGGGVQSETFNVSYSGADGAPVLIEGASAGGDVFNFANADQASFTVVWGGAGDNTFNFQTAADAHVSIVELNMAGVTAKDLEGLDLNKLEAYVDSHYAETPWSINTSGLGTTTPSIVIINPSASDTITVNGQKLESPELTLAQTGYQQQEDDPPSDPDAQPTMTMESNVYQNYQLTQAGYATFLDQAASSVDGYPDGYDAGNDPGFRVLTLGALGPGSSSDLGTDYYTPGDPAFSIDNFQQGMFGVTLPDEIEKDVRTTTLTDYVADPNAQWLVFTSPDGIGSEMVTGPQLVSEMLPPQNEGDNPNGFQRWVLGRQDGAYAYGWADGGGIGWGAEDGTITSYEPDGDAHAIPVSLLAPAWKVASSSSSSQTSDGPSYASIFDNAASQPATLNLSDYLLPPDSSGGGGGTDTPPPASITAFLANPESLDSQAGGFSIADTAANVAPALDALSADPNVGAITLTDSQPATLTMTVEQLMADGNALAAITNSDFGVAIVDSAANVSANLDALAGDDLVQSIALTDAGTPLLTVGAADIATDGAAFAKITNPEYVVAIADTAANVAGALGAIAADPRVSAIDLTDGGVPTLDLSVAQAIGDGSTLALITNSGYSIAATGTAADALANAAALAADPPVASIGVVDDAANIGAALAQLDANAQVTSITVRDTADNLATYGSILDADPKVTARVVTDSVAGALAAGGGSPIEITDSAANVAAQIDALNGLSSLTSITLTDTVPVLTLTVAQALGDGATLGLIVNDDYQVAIADSAENIAAHVNDLDTVPALTSVTLTDAGTSALDLSISDALANIGLFDVLTNTSYALALSGSAADVSNNLSDLAGLTNLTQIALTDGGTPVLTFALADWLADAATIATITSTYTATLSGTAADVSADIDALNADSRVGSIVLTDAGTPLSLTVAQALGDTVALAKISDQTYTVSVADSVANLTANAAGLAADSHVTSLIARDTAANIVGATADLSAIGCQSATVVDSAADVVANLGAIAADSLIKRIELTDSGTPTLQLTVAQLQADGNVLREIARGNWRIALVDSGANISGSLDVLAGIDAIKSVTLTDSGVSMLTLGVVEALHNEAFLAKITNPTFGFAISDTAAAVAAGLDALGADTRVASVFMTDGSPTLSLTLDQANANLALLAKIADPAYAISLTGTSIAEVAAEGAALQGLSNLTTVAITDSIDNVGTYAAELAAMPKLAVSATGSAAEIAANLDALNDNPAIVAIIPTGFGPVSLQLSALQAVSDGNAIGKIQAFTRVNVTDTAANVSAVLDRLSASWWVSSITFSDASAPTLDLSATDLVNDLFTLNRVTNGDYSIAITDTADNVLAYRFYPLSDSRVTSIAVVDTASAILGDSDSLANWMASDPRLANVVVTDSVANILGNADALAADGIITAIEVVDSAANVSSALDTLNAVPHLQAITLTDATPILDVTAAQVAMDTVALGAVSNTNVQLQVSDSAADVVANLDSLNGDARISAIILTDGGTPVLTVSFAQASADGATIAKIVSPYSLFISGTADDVEALTPAQIDTLGAEHAVALSVLDGSVSLTVVQALAFERDGLTLSVPTGATVALTDSSAQIQSLTAGQIAGLAALGITEIVGSDGNLAFDVGQSQAIAGAGLDVSVPAGDTVTENFADGSYRVVTFATGGAIAIDQLFQADGTPVTTVPGDHVSFTDDSTGGALLSTGEGNSITLTGTQETLTATGDDSSVRDFGTNDTTTMAGDHEVGEFYGTDGTIVSTGQGNYLILTGTQTVTVTGENTGINNAGTGIDITLSAAGDSLYMSGSDDIATVTGDHISVGDAGTNDVITLSGNFDNANVQGTNGTIVSTGHDNTIALGGDSQSVTVTGENTYVSNGGTGLTVALSAAGDSIDLTAGASGNTTTLATDGGSVRDFGSDNVTTMSGDHQVGQFYGTNGSVYSTGEGNYLILTGTQTVTVTGENTGINNLGTGIDITLSATGDYMNMTGSADTATVTGDHIAVGDAGTNDVTTLSGNFDNANLQGINGTIVSTGHDNTITLGGDSQTVTATGENTYVSNGGAGLTVALAAAGDSIDLTTPSRGNTTTLATDGGSVRDFGSDNVTTMSGDRQVGQFYGTNGTVYSTGEGNYLILTGTQTVTVTGENTGVNNAGDNISIQLFAAGDTMMMTGSHDATVVTGDHITVGDAGSSDTTLLFGNDDSANLSGTNGTVVSTGRGNSVTVSGSGQTISVTGEDTLVTNAGTNMFVSLSASGDSIGLTASSSRNFTQLDGDGLSVVDRGTNNVTTLAGDHETGEFYGDVGVISSTGDHNQLILDGSQLVTVSGADTAINDGGNGSVITLGGVGDTLILGGFSNSTTITADGVSVHDNFGFNQFTIANGAGNDTLQLSGSLSDTASFGAGIAYNQLWFAQSGQDLVVSVIGRDQSLTVSGWYNGTNNHLGELETADGQEISDAGMQQLVQAMSVYTPPAEGQTTLPPDLAAALAPALATNWHHA
jgi:hypothetical protein